MSCSTRQQAYSCHSKRTANHWCAATLSVHPEHSLTWSACQHKVHQRSSSSRIMTAVGPSAAAHSLVPAGILGESSGVYGCRGVQGSLGLITAGCWMNVHWCSRPSRKLASQTRATWLGLLLGCPQPLHNARCLTDQAKGNTLGLCTSLPQL